MRQGIFRPAFDRKGRFINDGSPCYIGVPNLTEIFNHGLGMYTSGIRDSERKGKSLGLSAIGDIPVEKVFPGKKTSQEDYKSILVDGLVKLRTMSAPSRRRLDKKLKAERYLEKHGRE